MYTEGALYLVSDVAVSSVQSPFFASTSLFKCREALDKNGTLIGEDMYDYQKELEHNFKQFQHKLQPINGQHSSQSTSSWEK